MRSVAVFAHNEEAVIARSLEAIRRAGLRAEDRVTVLVNGCRDRTAEIAEEFASGDRRFSVKVIALGDKANAWNVYAHQLAPREAEMHVFVDGDVSISEGCLDHLEAAFFQHPEALATSGMPRGGRRSDSWRRRIIANHGMPGNLYAIRGDAMRRIRSAVWLPVGLIGDDTLLRLLILRDLDPAGAPILSRIRPAVEAFFSYESCSLSSTDGLHALWRRQVRYTQREVQLNVLWSWIEAKGIQNMPLRIDELYSGIRPLANMFSPRVRFIGRRLLVPWVATAMKHTAGRALPATAWYESVP